MKRTLALLAILIAGCDSKPDKAPDLKPLQPKEPDITKPNLPVKPKPEGEPDRITVSHILIKHETKDAKGLAYELLDRARKGENFDDLKFFSEDQPPGVYTLVNRGVAMVKGEYDRDKMVPAFGDVGFKLKVGEIAIADFDEKISPYGWHIIKRIR